MSYNITFHVTKEGEVVVDTNASSLKTAPSGRFSISGHHVQQDEAGSESLAVTLFEDLETYQVVLQASSSKAVDRRPDGSDSA